MKKYVRCFAAISAILFLSVLIPSCAFEGDTAPSGATQYVPEPEEPAPVVEEPVEETPVVETPVVVEQPPAPEPPIVEPPVVAPVEDPVPEPEQEEEVKEETKKESVVVTVLAPILEYPAYIHDQCGAKWGIPATLQGEGHKELIRVITADGAAIPSSEIDLFTIDGALYITRHHSVVIDGAPVDAIDYYKQTGGEIANVESIPPKPTESRVTFSGVNWRIETSVINGVEFSYLYNLTPAMIAKQGDSGGKGAYMGSWPMVSGAVELDNGLLIMTNGGAIFFPVNRAGGNPVSEYGRLWR